MPTFAGVSSSSRPVARSTSGRLGEIAGLLSMLLCMLCLAPAYGFDPPTDEAGGLKATIIGPERFSVQASPFTVEVALASSGEEYLSGTVRLAGIDRWTVAPAVPVAFSVKAGEQVSVPFTVTVGPATYDAHYPLHAYAEFEARGQAFTVHPILVIETQMSSYAPSLREKAWRPFSVGADSSLGLWMLSAYRVLIRTNRGEQFVQPVGWWGSHGTTRANVDCGPPVNLANGSHPAIAMHPPWNEGRAGPVLLEFPLRLPVVRPIRLTFANAIRQQTAAEPPSDGVTFRVRVVSPEAEAGVLGRVVFERHTESKVWQPGEADLSEFAGQSIRLQFEAHPGPKNDTACDMGYWAEPCLSAGRPGSEGEGERLAGRLAMDAGLLAGRLAARGEGRSVYEVAIEPGRLGLLDATLCLKGAQGEVSLDGFDVTALGYDLRNARSPARLVSLKDESDEGAIRIRHGFESPEGTWDVVGEVCIGPRAVTVGFRMEHAPELGPWRDAHIEDVAVHAWSEAVRRVYAGVGNVLENPGAFSLPFDGHWLATSFVGFDFDNGLSVLQAVDVPPVRLDVNPGRHHYSLHAPQDQVVTLVVDENAWQAVRTWCELDSREASGGVPALAGRFVYDLWGGRYGDSARDLQRSFRYGMTNAMVVWHAWQRWGYDYRLPDIFPPDPHRGTLEEFRQLVEVCRQQGVLFAPHDNYIDFYPDCEGFTYQDIAHFSSGSPMRGWLNQGRGAQAYRPRPDVIRSYVERNLGLIREAFAPTAYFIDVFSSTRPHDYWSAAGEYHSGVETRRLWGETHAWIREYLGNDAPQISESGHDQLIGWLDGAQANHLRWGQAMAGGHGVMVWAVEAEDGERIPWLDAAHHHRFACHGAGYEPRYCSGLNTQWHGIRSDDYISAEVLTGHPGMIDSAFDRGGVRKYWLLDPLMRALAMARIETVAFAEDDIHRQHVVWEGDIETWVNRGQEDWMVSGHRLPQYGFFASVPERGLEAAIERSERLIVEWSRSPECWYVNARPSPFAEAVSQVGLSSIRLADDRQIELRMTWQAVRPAEAPYRVFVHFIREGEGIVFQGDFSPEPPMDQWRGGVETRCTAAIPADFEVGEAFDLQVGIYDSNAGSRIPVGGNKTTDFGQVTLLGEGQTLTGIAWSPVEAAASEGHADRVNTEGRLVDFTGVTTSGGCRITHEDGALLVTPLPGSSAFPVLIAWDRLPWSLPRPSVVETLNEDNQVLGRDPVEWERRGVVSLVCAHDGFCYRLTGVE